jgi:hypothetical protein
MALSRTAQVVVAVVTLLIAVACLIIAARPLFGRLDLIANQLRSSNWNVSGGRDSLDAAIGALHQGHELEWKSHLLAGSGMAFPISDDARQDTINDLADHAVSPSLLYQRGNGNISNAYAALVSNLSTSNDIDAATRQSAVALLTKFTLPIDNFVSYPVNTNPPQDVLDLWDRRGVALAQSAKCRGKVGARSGTGGQLDAEISVRPRYTVVDFIRPWVSENLLQEAAASVDPQVKSHFGNGGDLNEIPASLVVILPDQVSIVVGDSNSLTALKSLRASGSCCHVECLGLDMDLPNGAPSVEGDAFIGERNAPAPALYSLITHKLR